MPLAVQLSWREVKELSRIRVNRDPRRIAVCQAESRLEAHDNSLSSRTAAIRPSVSPPENVLQQNK